MGKVGREFVSRLFDRFSRSAESRGRTDGSGLGLAITQAYARAQGGDIVYEPAVPHGARFELVLPLGVPETCGPASGPRLSPSPKLAAELGRPAPQTISIVSPSARTWSRPTRWWSNFAEGPVTCAPAQDSASSW